MMGDLLLERSADISSCGLYRYRLERRWAPEPLLPFIMLNPSTADAELDDPTIRRCMAFARREHCGGIIVGNLYAFRATKPEDLWKASDPYGPGNDAALRKIALDAYVSRVPVVCGWGVHGGKWNGPIHIMQMTGAELRCLGKTKGGQPRHPLYVRGDQPLEPFR